MSERTDPAEPPAGALAILEGVARALTGVPGVAAALVFGSQAKGTARPDSDFDIAVLLEEQRFRASDKSRLLRSLIESLAQELSADRLDVVLLNDAPPKLAF